MAKNVIVIGGGIAGMESSSYLAEMGFNVTLLEKEAALGGHLREWELLFPTMRRGVEVLDFLKKGVENRVNVILNASVKSILRSGDIFRVELDGGANFIADAVLVTTGYDIFDARRKEEYGFGIYDNVITSADLEKLFREKTPLQTTAGSAPHRVAFVHCVGSRDEKAGHTYCSKVCCVTAVKQAIELKRLHPSAEVFCFYMDLRMYGMHFEAMYREAQEKYSVQFIRGRLSEACENKDGSILLKAEDTLAGRPMKMSVDMLVLMVGFVPAKGSEHIGQMLGLETGVNGFFKTRDQHLLTNVSNIPGVFFAGSCTAPKTITNTVTDARAAAATVAGYLKGYSIEARNTGNH
jgi:heterodisulfide reductase subunit A2